MCSFEALSEERRGLDVLRWPFRPRPTKRLNQQMQTLENWFSVFVLLPDSLPCRWWCRATNWVYFLLITSWTKSQEQHHTKLGKVLQCEVVGAKNTATFYNIFSPTQIAYVPLQLQDRRHFSESGYQISGSLVEREQHLRTSSPCL